MFCMHLVWIGGGGRGRGRGEGVSNVFILEMEMKFLCCQSKGWLIQWLAIMYKLLIILPPFLHISEDHCLLQYTGFLCSTRWWILVWSTWRFWFHKLSLSLFCAVPVSSPSHLPRPHNTGHICEAQQPKGVLPLS